MGGQCCRQSNVRERPYHSADDVYAGLLTPIDERLPLAADTISRRRSSRRKSSTKLIPSDVGNQENLIEAPRMPEHWQCLVCNRHNETHLAVCSVCHRPAPETVLHYHKSKERERSPYFS